MQQEYPDHHLWTRLLKFKSLALVIGNWLETEVLTSKYSLFLFSPYTISSTYVTQAVTEAPIMLNIAAPSREMD